MEITLKDYETIQNIMKKGLNNEDLNIAIKAAELVILDRIRMTLHKIYKHGIPLETNNN